MHYCAGCTRPVLDGVNSADVFKVNPLVFIYEEDRALCSLGNFLDLVFAKIRIKARLFIQPMSFVDDERIKCVF